MRKGTMANQPGDARRWLDMARADWQAAMAGSDAYSICFHAQQWAEKSAKALLAFHGARIPRNHNMSRLLSACQQLEPQLTDLQASATALQPFGVVERYSESKQRAQDSCAAVWSAATAIVRSIEVILESRGVRHG